MNAKHVTDVTAADHGRPHSGRMLHGCACSGLARIVKQVPPATWCKGVVCDAAVKLCFIASFSRLRYSRCLKGIFNELLLLLLLLVVPPGTVCWKRLRILQWPSLLHHRHGCLCHVVMCMLSCIA
jgi:hypothetical protein